MAGNVKTRDDGTPAFPSQPNGPDGLPTAELHYGMSLRDYFAAAALTGMLASTDTCEIVVKKSMVQFAYKMADAMIAERRKTA